MNPGLLFAALPRFAAATLHEAGGGKYSAARCLAARVLRPAARYPGYDPGRWGGLAAGRTAAAVGSAAFPGGKAQALACFAVFHDLAVAAWKGGGNFWRRPRGRPHWLSGRFPAIAAAGAAGA